MSSREDILGRIRAKLGRTAENAVNGRAALDAYLAARSPGPQPHIEGDLVVRFREKSALLSRTVEEVVSLQRCALVHCALSVDLPHRRCAGGAGRPRLARGPPPVEARPATAATWSASPAVSALVAETGTLMLCSGPATPAATSLLPETHIASVPAARIVAGMEEAWNLARTELGEMPRAVNFISGPSRTGDIEQTIVLGAHGPYRVHIVIVRGQ